MKKIIFLFIFTLFLLFISKNKNVYSAASYGNGVYTNICGTGTEASRNLCNKGCNIYTGTCSSGSNNVVKFVCDGRQIECRSNESSFSNSYNLSGVGCGKTVQIDVFTKNCRANGGWDCGTNDLLDYFTWYSGDCAQSQKTSAPTSTPKPTSTPQPTVTPTAIPFVSSCDELSIISGDGSLVPSNVKMRAKGIDSKAPISRYRFYFGDGKSTESDSAEVTHRYESSGTFNVRADIKDSTGNWKTSSACAKTVTIKPIPIIEGHKSNCSNVFILEGNQTLPPTNAKFSISGYDNKGTIKKYKLDFGDGNIEEKDTPNFEKRYDKPGTYEIKGYILDTEDQWKGGSNGCNMKFYVNTQMMQSQPKTGTPTLFSILGIGSGMIGLTLLSLKKKLIG